MTDYSPIYGTNPPTERERALFHKIAVEGRPLDEVARQLSLDKDSAARLVQKVSLWLALDQLGRDPHLLKVVHLRRLEHQWQSAMQAWHRSQENETGIKVIQRVDKDGKAQADRIEKTSRYKTGDVRYLNEARRILTEIRALCGAQGPINSEEDWIDVQYLTPQEREGELACRKALIRHRRRIAQDRRAKDRNPDQRLLFDL